MSLRTKVGWWLYDLAAIYLPDDLEPRHSHTRAVSQPTQVEEGEELTVPGQVVKAEGKAVWAPKQSGGVIMAEPPLVRADRLKRERGE